MESKLKLTKEQTLASVKIINFVNLVKETGKVGAKLMKALLRDASPTNMNAINMLGIIKKASFYSLNYLNMDHDIKNLDPIEKFSRDEGLQVQRDIGKRLLELCGVDDNDLFDGELNNNVEEKAHMLIMMYVTELINMCKGPVYQSHIVMDEIIYMANAIQHASYSDKCHEELQKLMKLYS